METKNFSIPEEVTNEAALLARKREQFDKVSIAMAVHAQEHPGEGKREAIRVASRANASFWNINERVLSHEFLDPETERENVDWEKLKSLLKTGVLSPSETLPEVAASQIDYLNDRIDHLASNLGSVDKFLMTNWVKEQVLAEFTIL